MEGVLSISLQTVNIYTNKMQELTDEELVKSVQNGKTDNFGILVDRYQDKIHRYAHRFLLEYEDRQDLTQEVFLKAFANIQSFDSSRRFSPWIYRIAHNEFINAIKKKGKEPLPFFDPDTLFPHPVAPDDPQDELYRKQIKLMMDSLLSKLNVKYREVLVLYYYEDLDYQTIADILKIPTSTVGVRLNRAKQQLTKLHEGGGQKGKI